MNKKHPIHSIADLRGTTLLVWAFISNRSGWTLSMAEIAQGCQIAKSAIVSIHLPRLKRVGAVTYDRNRKRSIRVLVDYYMLHPDTQFVVDFPQLPEGWACHAAFPSGYRIFSPDHRYRTCKDKKEVFARVLAWNRHQWRTSYVKKGKRALSVAEPLAGS